MLTLFRRLRIIAALFLWLSPLPLPKLSNAQALNASDNVQILSDFLALNQLNQATIIVGEEAAAAAALQPSSGQLDMAALAQIWSRKWLTVYRAVELGASSCKESKRELFRQEFSKRRTRMGVFVLNASSDLMQLQVLAPASDGNFYSLRQAWLLMIGEVEAARKVFSQYSINIDADVTLGVTLPNKTVLLYDIYKICSHCVTPLKVLYKGFWSRLSGFQLLPEFRQTFVQRRHDLERLRLKTATAFLEKPARLTNRQHLENDIDQKQLDLMQRKTYQLMRLLEPLFNLSYDIRFETAWGQLRNGSWDGVVGDLVSGRAEISLCPLRFTRERILAVNFLPELHTEYIRFIFRHPRRTVIRNIFRQPFEDSVWWAVLVLTVAAILLLWLLVRQEHRWQQSHQRSPQHSAPSLASVEPPPPPPPITTAPLEHKRFDFSVLVILTAIFMQGPSPDAFKLLSTRTLVITISLFTVMLMQFYGAFIVGSLLSLPPRTITDLAALRNSSLDIGMENISYNYELFVNTSNARAREIYVQRICKNPRRNVLPMKEGAQRVGLGGYAFHTGMERIYRTLQSQLTELEFCDLQEVSMEPPFTSSAVLRRDSPFREHFASGILRLRLSGLQQYNEKKWRVNKPDCTRIQNGDVQVDIEHFGPALIFLALSMLAAVMVLLIEVTVNWCEKCRRKSRGGEREGQVKGRGEERKKILAQKRIKQKLLYAVK